MNNISGGYKMINLDDTTNLYNEIKNAYEAGKPIIAYKNNIANYATIEKKSSDYYIYFANGVSYSIAQYGGSVVVTAKNTFLRYRHILKCSGTIAGGSKTLTIIYDSLNENPVTTPANACAEILRYWGCNSATDGNVLLVADDTAGSALIYITSSMGTYTLHSKAIGAASYSNNVQSTLTFTDKVITLY